MRLSRLGSAAVLAAASLSVGGCATYGQMGGVGVSVGYGSPYGYSRYGSPYGYSSYGYSPYGYSRYGYSPYGSRYGYSPYGYSGYGYSPYWGWNDGFYYPGSGFYVYDRYRRPHRMTDRQRRYWSDRQRTSRSGDGNKIDLVQNWDDFRGVRRTDDSPVRVESRDDPTALRSSVTTRKQVRVERRDDRPAVRTSVTTRKQVRAERRDDREEARRAELRARLDARREKRQDD